jgi:hypothetical protein
MNDVDVEYLKERAKSVKESQKERLERAENILRKCLKELAELGLSLGPIKPATREQGIIPHSIVEHFVFMEDNLTTIPLLSEAQMKHWGIKEVVSDKTLQDIQDV